MIFLDHNATTPMLEVARDAMSDILDKPLNPSSVHGCGRMARSYMDNARKQIINMLGVDSRDKQYNLTFTASGTEANNLILNNYAGGDVFISSTEHASVEMPAKMMPNTYILPVTESGILDLELLDRALAGSSARKKLVSVMLANNEIGTIQPLKDIVRIAHKHGAQMHSDIVQAAGKWSINLVDCDLDFASISGHKFGGGVGCGALIAKANLHIQPTILGGGQERSTRSGTENVLAIVAAGAAAEHCQHNLDQRVEYLSCQRDYLEQELKSKFSNVQIVNEGVERLPNTTALIVPEKSASLMVVALDLQGIAIGSGSACSSGKVSKSKVLAAMGYDDSLIESAIRVSVGMQTTRNDIDAFLDAFASVIS